MKIKLSDFKILLFFLYSTFYVLSVGSYSSQFSVVTKMFLQFLFVGTMLFSKGLRSNGKTSIVIAVLVTLLCFTQLLFLGTTNFTNLMIGVWLFGCLAQVSSRKLLPSFGIIFQVLASLASIDVLYCALNNGEFAYFRDEVFIDKVYITLLYSLSFMFCLMNYFNNRQKILNLAILCFNLFVNVFLVQSKIAIVVFFVSLFIMLIWGVEKKSKEIKKLLYYVGTIIIVVWIAFPDIALPQEIKYAINLLTGSDIFTLEVIESEHSEITYTIRDALWAYALSLFYDNPILGIGIGEFIEHKFVFSKDIVVVETESSLINILTEGGLAYFAIVVFMFFKGIKAAIVKFREQHQFEYLFCIVYFCSCIIMIIGNDFMDSYFWILMGLIMGIVNEKETSKLSNYDKNEERLEGLYSSRP
ncbi:MAG: O-antigen ligase family protein [Prevotella sp.]|nr:O-antigen ligase family protein [Prevotella sp.]